MTDEPHVQDLTTLKIIAETLNQSNDLTYMLDTVLGKLLEVTELSFGWIFLVGPYHEYECVADRNLPPALLYGDKQLMQCGSCWCLDRFRHGRLKNAVNILSCKRLEDARNLNTGETCGFTHHATVPLRIGDRKLGIMNVGAFGKEHFSNEELALLEAVALQLGIAVERMRLHEAEQRRAELYIRLGEFSRSLSVTLSGGDARRQLSELAMKLVKVHFAWPVAILFQRSDQGFILRNIQSNERMLTTSIYIPSEKVEWLEEVAHSHGFQEIEASSLSILSEYAQPDGILPLLHSAMAAPFMFGGHTESGVLLIGHPKPGALSHIDGTVLEAVAEHIAAQFEIVRLEENRQLLARMEERNGLARDLHDSVSQLLFSISMTAKGVESLLDEPDLSSAKTAIQDMQLLSRDALKEMRALIKQLRPAGLEQGIAAALKEHGSRLGLHMNMQLSGVLALPSDIENALWRIGQEALNNVSKHAGASRVDMTLIANTREVILSITDFGRGIAEKTDASTSGSFGLSIMRERAEGSGGRFQLTSVYGKGTRVEVAIPLPSQSKRRLPLE